MKTRHALKISNFLLLERFKHTSREKLLSALLDKRSVSSGKYSLCYSKGPRRNQILPSFASIHYWVVGMLRTAVTRRYVLLSEVILWNSTQRQQPPTV
ncbi:unnamed protein product [Litomosoides sigmodontis]|uniref:Uncharacterized protein n=1 Tax=Litomosoides sigmodontis TaxID=42156 RepID=A0A3P6TM49_LITSI|nr:unnamed protein product [Litomosoides sigmodontis]